MARGEQTSGDGEPVLVGSWYQDSEVTAREVLGIVGVILALAVLGWFFFARGGSLVITPDAVAADGGGPWPFTVQEVTVQCTGDGPTYRFETTGGTTQQVSDGLAGVPKELRRTRADGGFVPMSAVVRVAQDFCSS